MTEISVESAIIKYIEEVEESSRLADKMGEKLGRVFAKYINKKRKILRWEGKIGKKFSEIQWIAPIEWRTKNDADDNYDLYIILDEKDRLDDDSSDFYISSLLGVAGSGFGFYLETDALGRRDWKKLLREETKIINKLTKSGFVCDPKKGALMTPIRINKDKLAEAFADDNFDEALQPVGAAIDRIVKDQSTLDQLVAGIRKAQQPDDG